MQIQASIVQANDDGEGNDSLYTLKTYCRFWALLCSKSFYRYDIEVETIFVPLLKMKNLDPKGLNDRPKIKQQVIGTDQKKQNRKI